MSKRKIEEEQAGSRKVAARRNLVLSILDDPEDGQSKPAFSSRRATKDELKTFEGEFKKAKPSADGVKPLRSWIMSHPKIEKSVSEELVRIASHPSASGKHSKKFIVLHLLNDLLNKVMGMSKMNKSIKVDYRTAWMHCFCKIFVLFTNAEMPERLQAATLKTLDVWKERALLSSENARRILAEVKLSNPKVLEKALQNKKIDAQSKSLPTRYQKHGQNRDEHVQRNNSNRYERAGRDRSRSTDQIYLRERYHRDQRSRSHSRDQKQHQLYSKERSRPRDERQWYGHEYKQDRYYKPVVRTGNI